MSKSIELRGKEINGCLAYLVPVFIWTLIGANIVESKEKSLADSLLKTTESINNLLNRSNKTKAEFEKAARERDNLLPF